jgi:hypothetical protein
MKISGGEILRGENKLLSDIFVKFLSEGADSAPNRSGKKSAKIESADFRL